MPMDGFTLGLVAGELNAALAGGRISKIVQPERDEILRTIRNEGVNRMVGGVPNSQHLQGCAADIRPCDPKQFQRLVAFLKTCEYTDQLLTGNGWLHISWNPFGSPRHYIRIGYYK